MQEIKSLYSIDGRFEFRIPYREVKSFIKYCIKSLNTHKNTQSLKRELKRFTNIEMNFIYNSEQIYVSENGTTEPVYLAIRLNSLIPDVKEFINTCWAKFQTLEENLGFRRQKIETIAEFSKLSPSDFVYPLEYLYIRFILDHYVGKSHPIKSGTLLYKFFKRGFFYPDYPGEECCGDNYPVKPYNPTSFMVNPDSSITVFYDKELVVTRYPDETLAVYPRR